MLTSILSSSLKNIDSELYSLIKLEEKRQQESIELIASENMTSLSVMECLGSCLTNKYSEGYPNERYYGGNEYIDKIELLCQKRCLDAFNLNKNEWGVNVQSYSGSPANFAVYTALLNPHDRIMGMELSSGGHLTHGFYSDTKRISASSIYFESLPYKVDEITGLIDYNELELLALRYKPKLIICGYSGYSHDLNYEKFREIADKVNAYLMCDMAHFSGFVATKLLDSPFKYCDIVTSTTHKTLRGPRAGIIFYKKDNRDLGIKINKAVFPTLQGGPHNNQIAAIATQMLQITTSEYNDYMFKVHDNAQKLCNFLQQKGYTIQTGSTENHILLLNLRNKNITGNKVEKVCELANISVNKNTIVGDKSALSPSGIRIGTAYITSRGMNDIEKIGELLHRCIELALKIQIIEGIETPKGVKLNFIDFNKHIMNNPKYINEVNEIRNDVIEFAWNYPIIKLN